MRITVTRSGGVAAIRRHGEVDTSDRADADGWHELVRRADLANVPPSRPAPDRFVYTVGIDETEVKVGEADLTGPQRELVERVLAQSHP